MVLGGLLLSIRGAVICRIGDAVVTEVVVHVHLFGLCGFVEMLCRFGCCSAASAAYSYRFCRVEFRRLLKERESSKGPYPRSSGSFSAFDSLPRHKALPLSSLKT